MLRCSWFLVKHFLYKSKAQFWHAHICTIHHTSLHSSDGMALRTKEAQKQHYCCVHDYLRMSQNTRQHANKKTAGCLLLASHTKILWGLEKEFAQLLFRLGYANKDE